ncbi:hypothetical protein P7C71_g5922, partial [Lecanoromycetidae sp. Uapishka_2]
MASGSVRRLGAEKSPLLELANYFENACEPIGTVTHSAIISLKLTLAARRTLSDVIKHGRCQILKLIAGSMILYMLNDGVSPEAFWPTEIDQELFAKFPRSGYHDIQWITAFEDFVDCLSLGHVLAQKSDVLFAHAVLIGNTRYETVGDSAILVTMSDNLNIIVTASSTESAIYVDVPLEKVQSVTLDQVLSTQSQTPTYGLVIAFRRDLRYCYYVNAAGHNDSVIALAFMSEGDAKTARRIIQHTIPVERKSIETGQSTGINTSGPLHNSGLANTSLTDDDLRETARRATVLVTQNPPTSGPRELQAEYNNDTLWVGTNVSKALEEIDCSLNEDEFEANTIIDPIAWEASVRGNILNNINAPGSGPQTSPKSHTGRRGTVQDEDVSHGGENGFDSAYDLSPRPDKALRRVCSVVDPSKLAQSNEALGNVASGADTRKANIESRPPKLSKRLQNENGKIEANSVESVSASSGTNIAKEKLIKGPGKTPRGGFPAKVNAQLKKAPNTSNNLERKKVKKTAQLKHSNNELGKNSARQNPTDHPHIMGESSAGATKARGKNLGLDSADKTKQDPSASPNSLTKPAEPREQGYDTGNADNDLMWDAGLVPSEDDVEAQPQQSAATESVKKSKSPVHEAEKGKKAQRQSKKANPQRKQNQGQSRKAQSQLAVKPDVKRNVAPIALTQPRSRREAATVANKKIQHIMDSDEIVDDESELTTEPTMEPKQRSSAAAITQSHGLDPAEIANVRPTTRGDSDSFQEEEHRRPQAIDGPIREHPQRGSPSRNLQPTLRPVHDSIEEDASSPENVNLIPEPRGNELLETPLPAKSDPSMAEKMELQEQAPLCNTSGDKNTTGQDNANDSNQTLVPDSVPNIEVASSKTEKNGRGSAHEEQPENFKAVIMVGEREQASHPTSNEVPALSETVMDQSINRSTRGRDPFVDKLSILAAEIESGHEQVKEKRKTQNRHSSGKKTSNAVASNQPEAARAKAAPSLGQSERSVGTGIPVKAGDNSGLQENPRSPKRRGIMEPEKEPLEAVAAPRTRQPTLQKTLEDFQAPQKLDQAINHSPPIKSKVELARQTKDLHKAQSRPRKSTPAVGIPQETINTDAPAVPRQGKGERSEAALVIQAKQHGRENAPPKIVETTSINASDLRQATPLPKPVRRVPMVCFSASGPRNQGTVSNEELRRATQDHEAEEIVAQKNPPVKRKFFPYLDNPAPWERHHAPKRQKKDVDTPPTRHKHVPQMLPEPSPNGPRAEVRRPSSQGTRVMANGSPMPIVHSRNDPITILENHSDNREVKKVFAQAGLAEIDDDQFIVQDDWNEPTLPLPQDNSMSGSIALKSKEYPGNSKQLPSSPHAPSALDTMPVHHVYHNGAIVNTQTNEHIVPSQPQDPFMGASQKSSGPFMKALRKASDMDARHRSDQANKQKTTIGLKRSSQAFTEDPDKTLVEPTPPPKKRKDLPFVPVRHLIDEEIALKDMVKDYATGGNNLISGYEKERQKCVDTEKAKVDHLRQDLISKFEKARVDQGKIRKAMKKRSLNDIEAEWNVQQEKLMAAARVALADCIEK